MGACEKKRRKWQHLPVRGEFDRFENLSNESLHASQHRLSFGLGVARSPASHDNAVVVTNRVVELNADPRRAIALVAVVVVESEEADRPDRFVPVHLDPVAKLEILETGDGQTALQNPSKNARIDNGHDRSDRKNIRIRNPIV